MTIESEGVPTLITQRRHCGGHRGGNPGNFEDDAEVELRYHAMPASLERALLPFQREGVRFGLRRRGRALIADEMGVTGSPSIYTRAVVMRMAEESSARHMCIQYWPQIWNAQRVRPSPSTLPQVSARLSKPSRLHLATRYGRQHLYPK